MPLFAATIPQQLHKYFNCIDWSDKASFPIKASKVIGNHNSRSYFNFICKEKQGNWNPYGNINYKMPPISPDTQSVESSPFWRIIIPDGSKPSIFSSSRCNLNLFQLPKKSITRPKKLLATNSV